MELQEELWGGTNCGGLWPRGVESCVGHCRCLGKLWRVELCGILCGGRLWGELCAGAVESCEGELWGEDVEELCALGDLCVEALCGKLC